MRLFALWLVLSFIVQGCTASVESTVETHNQELTNPSSIRQHLRFHDRLPCRLQLPPPPHPAFPSPIRVCACRTQLKLCSQTASQCFQRYRIRKHFMGKLYF